MDKAETKVAEQNIKESAKVTFPVVYFAFNSLGIKQNELSQLNGILPTWKENPNMKVTVTVITAKRKACGIKNEMRFSDGKTKCAIKKHPSNETWMLFC